MSPRLLVLVLAGLLGAAHHAGLVEAPRIEPLERSQRIVQERQQRLVERLACRSAQLRALESDDPAALATAPQRCG